MAANLILHAGANVATEEQILQVPTPLPQGDWHPIAHSDLIHSVERAATQSGWEIVRKEYGLFREGDRMFGVMMLSPSQLEAYAPAALPDYQLALGLRNSHDKSMSAGLVVGTRVFVCDNLAFSGEVKLLRKHTRFIYRDLDRLVMQAMGRVGEARRKQDQRIASYKETELGDTQVHDFLIRSVDARVIPNADIPKVLGEYRKPQHEEFESRTAWSLFNAYTEIMKGVNPMDLPMRTQRLHGMMDSLSGVLVGTPVEQPAGEDGPDWEIVTDPRQAA